MFELLTLFEWFPKVWVALHQIACYFGIIISTSILQTLFTSDFKIEINFEKYAHNLQFS